MFKYVDIDFQKDAFWYWLPRLIVFLFMLSVGLSFSIAHKNRIKKAPYFKRLAKIGICAIGISISTYFLFPNNWVYFGTLHCIFFSTILITPFRKSPYLSLVFFYVFIGLELSGVQIPFFQMEHAAMDYIPIWPWIGYSFLGIFLAHHDFHKFKTPNVKALQLIRFLGRHALIIYLTHQPLMYGLIYLYTTVTS